jgi:hypothetical protein
MHGLCPLSLTPSTFCPILRSVGGVWRRPVARGVWDAEVGGSSPLTPTVAVFAGVAQLAELLPSKQVVARSNRVARSDLMRSSWALLKVS